MDFRDVLSPSHEVHFPGVWHETEIECECFLEGFSDCWESGRQVGLGLISAVRGGTWFLVRQGLPSGEEDCRTECRWGGLLGLGAYPAQAVSSAGIRTET